MERIPVGLQRAAVLYVVLILAVVVTARLGLYPGVGDAHPGSPLFAHPYRVAMAATVAVLAALLGAGSAVVGSATGSRFLGFAALLAGGILTGLLLSAAPFLLYPGDQYPVSFLWVMLGAPLGFVSWAIGATLLKRGGGELLLA